MTAWFAHRWRVALLLFAVTLLAYFPAVRGSLIWNDSDYVTRPALQSVAGLRRIWFEVGATEQYYPLLHSAFWLEHRLWGDAPVGYHLTNVLLHALAACLFIAVLQRLGVRGAVFAGFLFALHPVCVESVAWISEQKNTLSTVFYLAAALAYLRYARNREPAWYGLALAGFACALLSKSVTASLPAALLIACWWQRGRLAWKEDVAPFLPWFVLGAADGLFTAWVEHSYIGAKGSDFLFSWPQRFLVAGRAFWFYLGKLAWPAHLIFIYPRWHVDPARAGPYLFPLAAIVLLLGLWRYRRRSRAPLAAFLFFAGTLFPILGFFNIFAFIFSFVADHFQYLATLGIFALAAATAARWRSPLAPVAGALLLALLGVLSWRQSRMYSDMVTFYRTTLARNPDSWMGHQNLGVTLLGLGHIPEARQEYEASLRIKPNNALAEYDLGNVFYMQAQLPAAGEHYRRALALEPDYVKAHYALGRVLFWSGHPAEAVAHYREAIRLDPTLPKVRGDLGHALIAQGQMAEALEQFRLGLRIEPDSVLINSDLGRVLVQAGRPADAIGPLTRALALAPKDAEVQYNLALALAQTNRLAEAIVHFLAASELKPDDVDTRVNLALALANTGRIPEAIAQCEAALRLQPGFPPALSLLPQLRSALGQPGAR